MPTYDYECPTCGNVKEVSHSVSEIGKIEVLCDDCHQPMKKLLSIPTLIGFDNVGRSIGRKESEKDQPKDKPAETTAKKDTSSASTSKKDKAA